MKWFRRRIEWTVKPVDRCARFSVRNWQQRIASFEIVWEDECAEAWMVLWIEWINHNMNESYPNLRHSNLKFWLKFNNEAGSSMIASVTVGLETSMTYRPAQKWFTRSHGRRTFVTRLVAMVMVMTMATHRRVQTENWQTDKHMLWMLSHGGQFVGFTWFRCGLRRCPIQTRCPFCWEGEKDDGHALGV